MANSQQSPSHGKLIVVVTAAAVVVVLAVLSAFVWPGWAVKSEADASSSSQTSQHTAKKSTPDKPTIDAVPLPDDASNLLSSMPDSVRNFARVAAKHTQDWSASSPLEEYTLTYSTGTKGEDVTLIVAQWSTSDKAENQYTTLTGNLNGTRIAAGEVKVSGASTGNYEVKSTDNGKNAVAVWRNDTVVFRASGAQDSVDTFYRKFPM